MHAAEAYLMYITPACQLACTAQTHGSPPPTHTNTHRCLPLCLQVTDEAGSAMGFTDIKFSNNGNMILAAVEGRLYLLDAYKGSIIKRFNTVMSEGGVAGEACITADNQYLIAGMKS